VVTDHIGMVSGRKIAKSDIFDVFYGGARHGTDDRAVQSHRGAEADRAHRDAYHDLFVGEVVGTFADIEVLTNGVVDIAKLKPLLFDMASKQYWSLGKPLARCWSVGKDYEGKA